MIIFLDAASTVTLGSSGKLGLTVAAAAAAAAGAAAAAAAAAALNDPQQRHSFIGGYNCDSTTAVKTNVSVLWS